MSYLVFPDRQDCARDCGQPEGALGDAAGAVRQDGVAVPAQRGAGAPRRRLHLRPRERVGPAVLQLQDDHGLHQSGKGHSAPGIQVDNTICGIGFAYCYMVYRLIHQVWARVGLP